MSGLCERFQRMKTCEYWTIAYRKRGTRNLIHEEKIDGFMLLPQKKYVTQADPFLYVHQGKNWLFYEKQNLTDMKGTLWCCNLDAPKEKPVKVLEEAFHLSYPQIFRYGKYTYMLPETKCAEEIRLYRCMQFPGKWEQVETLFDLAAVDTTIFRGDDCYAFTYVDGHLEIYVCELEEENFRIVQKERIYTSGQSKICRPGGALWVEEDGKCYRPVQNCTDYYGQELIINEISRLDREGFAEREYRRFSPNQIMIPGVNAVGIHTYNRNEQYEVIDILHRECSILTVLKKIQWKLWNRLKKEKA